MSDYLTIQYPFEDSLSTDDLEAVLAYLNQQYELALPYGFQYEETVRSAEDVTSPDHYAAELEAGLHSVEVPLPGGTTPRFAPEASDAADESALALAAPSLKFTVLEGEFQPNDDETDEAALERIDKLYTLIGDFYEYLVEIDLAPEYVYGIRGEERRRIASDEDDLDLSLESIEERPMPDLYWCQIVPPDRASAIGVETLLSVPAYRTEQLADGAVLLVTRHLVNTREPELVELEGDEREIVEHLGIPSGWDSD